MKILRFTDFVNEQLQNDILFEAKNYKKLLDAANIIKTFINRKLGTEYIIVDSEVIHNGVSGIMMYDNNGNSAIKVSEPVGKTIGVVGSLSYFQDHAAEIADLEITSEMFPIVKLLGEFTKLISDPNYAANVNESEDESLVLEKRPALSPETIKQVETLLNQGVSASKIAKDLGVKYGQILQLSRGVSMKETPSKMVVKNEETLADKVKYLDELLEDVYEISRRIAAGAFNSLFISGRAGTGKTFKVEEAMKDEGLVKDKDFTKISGGVSAILMYKKLFEFNGKTVIFDDADGVFADPEGRNVLKAALDSKKVRQISWMKMSPGLYNATEYMDDPDSALELIDAGQVPNSFEFTGRVIFISNLPKEKADPDGAIRSRSILIDVSPDDATLIERMRTLLPHLDPKDMSMESKQEVFEFMKSSKNVSMRTFEKAANFKMAGLVNWKRMAERYV